MQITPAGLNLLEAANQAIEAEQNNFVALNEEQSANLNQLLEAMLQE
jgi:hypothetical protein